MYYSVISKAISFLESLSAEGNDESGEADLPYIMHVLGDIEGLPPGGGLSSK